MVLIEKKCLNCGKLFTSYSLVKKYCCYDCGYEYNKHKIKSKYFYFKKGRQKTLAEVLDELHSLIFDFSSLGNRSNKQKLDALNEFRDILEQKRSKLK